jgi:hypothetical protein
MASRVESKRTGFAACAERPCAQCPWRTENQGKRHPLSWYTKANLRKLWKGLRRGERMTCHPTDPDNPPEPGKRGAPEGVATRECAGAQILVQRELTRFGELLESGVDDPWGAYQAQHPMGLTKIGMSLAAMNVQWGGAMPGTLEVGAVDLNDSAVGYAELTPWKPR